MYGDHSGKAQLLLDMSDAVHEATGFRMQFDFKEFDATIEVPDDFVYEGLLTFEQKAADFESRQQLRAEEIEAIEKAIEIISSAAVQGNAEKHLPTLLQSSLHFGQ